ncbi:MAG: threonylcarbamoyl-AMP synthase, partial [Bacteroidetes bacterium]
MPAILLKVHPANPQERHLSRVVEALREGAVIIYPTDTVYGLGCDIQNKRAVHRLCQIKGIDPAKSHLTCVCESTAIIGTYANQVSTPVYKLMRRALPGPYTFILKASREIPRHFQHKKTVGIRVVDHPITQRLTELLGNPLASISLPADEDPAYISDPEVIIERYLHQVDFVMDAGVGHLTPSTVIDCSRGEDEIVVLREGAGPLAPLGLTL